MGNKTKCYCSKCNKQYKIKSPSSLTIDINGLMVSYTPNPYVYKYDNDNTIEIQNIVITTYGNNKSLNLSYSLNSTAIFPQSIITVPTQKGQYKTNVDFNYTTATGQIKFSIPVTLNVN